MLTPHTKREKFDPHTEMVKISTPSYKNSQNLVKNDQSLVNDDQYLGVMGTVHFWGDVSKPSYIFLI